MNSNLINLQMARENRMDHALRHVSVEPGDNIVARFGNAAGVFSTRTSTDAEKLIDALEAAGEKSAYPGNDLALRLMGVLADSLARVGSFAIVAALDKGYVVLLHGSAWAHVTTDDTTVHLAGDSALTWVDRVITSQFSEIMLTVSSNGPRPVDPRSDLRLGSVSGNGLVIRAKGFAKAIAMAPSDVPITAPTPTTANIPVIAEPVASAPEPIEEPQATQAVSAVDFLDDDDEPDYHEPDYHEQTEDDDRTMAAPAAESSGRNSDVTDGAPITAGGATTDGETQMVSAFTTAPAPVLVGNDGSRVILDRNYVLGRDPRSDSAVRRGDSSPITIPDNSGAVSRVHAYIDASNSAIMIRDNNSTNGTFIASPGASEWIRLTQEPATLEMGWAVCIGNRVYVLQNS